MEPGRDRLGLVEEPDEPVLLVLEDLPDHERQFVLCGGRQLVVAHAALHVEDDVPLVDVLPDIDAVPHRDRRALLRGEFEELELVLADRVRDRFPLVLRPVRVALR